MDKQFPSEIHLLASKPTVKKVFISDVTPTGPRDCENCGGVGAFAVFCALKGPFQAPGAPYQKDGEHSLTNHFDAGAGRNGGWWVGITYTFPCPMCKGEVRAEPVKAYPVQAEIGRFVHPDTEEVLEW